MNRLESSRSFEAKLRYLGGDFEVLSPGGYVSCAVSGEKIPLDELKYWSVARQEAYATCELSHQREVDSHPEMRKRSK